jgi:tRNA uridine 5-carboxymethylaminomethyl modification enzyme
VAGINAARGVRRLAPFELRRDEAYVGILVDDLITKGCLEPYRMFTSRAEHRLLLRIDNADLRLTPRGREAGLVDDGRWEQFVARKERFGHNLAVLDRTLVRTPSGDRVPAVQLLRQPEIRLAHLAASGQVSLDVSEASPDVDLMSAETVVKYAGYLRRQEVEIERARKDERRRIPPDFPFDRVPGLSREVIHRLTDVRPDTLGQALRIPGITPAAVAVLSSYVGRF